MQQIKTLATQYIELEAEIQKLSDQQREVAEALEKARLALNDDVYSIPHEFYTTIDGTMHEIVFDEEDCSLRHIRRTRRVQFIQ